MSVRADEPAADPRRWAILAVLGLTQLMVVLDATIINVALPDATSDLSFAPEDRQWVVTAYALAFGGLLLIGGRLSDRWGQRPTLLGGLIGFAVMSTVGGAANTFGLLIAARAGQGVFAAVMAPAALSLLNVTFTDPAERTRAFGVFGAVGGAGASVGLLLGGALTDYLDWRWCLYINDVFAVAAAVGTVVLVARREPTDAHGRLDLPGTTAIVVSLLALVYGASRAEVAGWTSPPTLGLLLGGVLLLVGFLVIERRATAPLVPLRVLVDRTRSGSLLALAVATIGVFAVFLFLTFYLQENLGLSPMLTGVAFIPVVIAISVAAAAVAPRMLDRYGARRPVLIGSVLGGAGMALLSRLEIGGDYWSDVLPGGVVVGLGIGLIFGSATAAATERVEAEDTGVASALVNAVQQIGGALGTAVLTSIAAQSAVSATGSRAAATVDGYADAFLTSAGVFVVMAVLGWFLVPALRSKAARGADASGQNGGRSIRSR